MLQVNVSFPSGSGETLQLPEHSKVGDLRLLAPKTFRKGFLKLVTFEGMFWPTLRNCCKAAGVQDGENITAVAQRASLSATLRLLLSGAVEATEWLPGAMQMQVVDCSAIQDQLEDVQQIQAASVAFAAILSDGSVVAWGIQKMVVTALQFRISSRMCSKFKPRIGHLLRSWPMDPSLLGVIQSEVVTALQFRVSWRMCNN